MRFELVLKILLVANFVVLSCDSRVAIASGVTTQEKWLCSKGDSKRVVRLTAPAGHRIPCKVFYYKRLNSDPKDSQIEGRQDLGDFKPLYYSNGSWDFCVRKTNELIQEKILQNWTCRREI